MEELLKNKEFKAKMSSLSPGVKKWFINALVDLFEQESEFVIDVLEDCRYELGRTAEDFVDQSEQLRAESRLLADRRDIHNVRSVSSLDSRPTPSRLSALSEDGSSPTLSRRRERFQRRRVICSDDDSGSGSGRSSSSSNSGLQQRREADGRVSSLSVPAYPVSARSPSPSARGSRSLPVTPQPGGKTIEEETKAILKTMSDADAHAHRERERQQERLERLRRQKKFLAEDRTAQAMKLLEKALEMDRVLAKDKERQGNLLKDKLEELKKRRQRAVGPAASAPGLNPPVTARDVEVIEDLENC